MQTKWLRHTKMWTKQQAHWMLKYILKLSLLAPHTPAKHGKCSVRSTQGFLTWTDSRDRAGSKGRTTAHRCLIAWHWLVNLLGEELTQGCIHQHYTCSLLRGVYPTTSSVRMFKVDTCTLQVEHFVWYVDLIYFQRPTVPRPTYMFM